MENILSGELAIEQDQYPVLYKDTGLQKFLDTIKEEVEKEKQNLDLNPETDKGRKAIGSLARKVSSSKTCIEKPGRDYLKQLKAAVKPAETEIKRFVDEVDAIRDSILKPRDEWQEKENARKQAHEDHIAHIRSYLTLGDHGDTAEDIRQAIEYFSELKPTEAMEEFFSEAESLYSRALERLQGILAAREKHESEQAELERLRREKEEREREDQRKAYYRSMINHIKSFGLGIIDGQQYPFPMAKYELTEKVHIDESWGEFREEAEAELKKALDNIDAAEKEAAEEARAEEAKRVESARLNDLKGKLDKLSSYRNLDDVPQTSSGIELCINVVKNFFSNNDFQEFQSDAEVSYKEAIDFLSAELEKAKERETAEKEAEAERIRKETEERIAKEAEQKRQKEEAEARKREQNKRHRGKINREARDAIVALGLTNEQAESIVSAIAKGEIPNVTIVY